MSGTMTRSDPNAILSCDVKTEYVVDMVNHRGDGDSYYNLYTSIILPSTTVFNSVGRPFPSVTPLVWIPPADFDPVTEWSYINSDELMHVPFPADLISQLAEMPNVLIQVPTIAECFPGFIFGAPTAKVVVNELTVFTSTTISMDQRTETVTKGPVFNEGTTKEEFISPSTRMTPGLTSPSSTIKVTSGSNQSLVPDVCKTSPGTTSSARRLSGSSVTGGIDRSGVRQGTTTGGSESRSTSQAE